MVQNSQIEGGSEMLLSDLAGKEIINLYDGAKLGQIGDADLTISQGGSIEAIILTSRSGHGSFWGSMEKERDTLVIPWQAVKKVGSEVIIVDMDNKADRMNKYSV
jgi:YlmC/YmxH family sporulation protein